MRRRGFFVAGAIAAVVAACAGGSAPPPLAVTACDSTAAAASAGAVDSFALSDVGVYLDATDPSLDPVRADLASYLGAMWGGPVTVAAGAPDGTKTLSVWISSSAAAATRLGTTLGTPTGAGSDAGTGAGTRSAGYAMKRIDDGGATTLLVYAAAPDDLAAGAYALLETFGARFFHPKQELVPSLGAPRVPHTLDVWRTPLTGRRGLQPHTLHPIEYFDVFMQPSDANLADAKRYVDWLVKTGQNYVQWPLLSTVDWTTWKPYAQSILDYAHSRNVKVGAVPEVWGGSSLQNNYVLVTDATKWQAQMTAGLDQLLTLPWDVVELTLGEFTSTDPGETIEWLDFATQYVLEKAPGTVVNVENHVGNYPDLWVKYQGQTVFYYHLGAYCDARLGQNVHTLSVFDLFRDWATYAHPNFFLQRDYILQELPLRRVSYFPESAYWISADVDVPLFLPMTIWSRWNDIHTLSAELADRGLPPLDGHVMFSSGHEWGFWMTDYLVAHMLWAPDEPFDAFVSEVAGAYGSCAGGVHDALSTFTQLENTYLFDDRLLAYVQGEDATVDEGYLAGLETHPKRVEFEDLLAMSPADLASFESNVVARLESFASQVQPIEDSVAAMCRGSDATLAPWCGELWDGISIVRLRAQHTALLYRAVLAYVGGGDGTGLLSEAQSVSAQAAQVVARREAGYRFDLDRLTGAYANPTVYGFGYLRQAHTLCYWSRREQQVSYLLENGVPEGLFSLPNCQD